MSRTKKSTPQAAVSRRTVPVAKKQDAPAPKPRRTVPPKSQTRQNEEKRGRGRPQKFERPENYQFCGVDLIQQAALASSKVQNRTALLAQQLGIVPPTIMTEVPELWQLSPTDMLPPDVLKEAGPIRDCKHDGKGAPQVRLTAPLLQAICYGVERGLSLSVICKYLGLDMKVLSDWRRQGKTPKGGMCYHLARGIEAASARFELAYLDIIQKAAHGMDHQLVVKQKKVFGEIVEETSEFKTGKPNPQAAQWLLERLLANRYQQTMEASARRAYDEDDYDDDDNEGAEGLAHIDRSVLGAEYGRPIDVEAVGHEEE